MLRANLGKGYFSYDQFRWLPPAWTDASKSPRYTGGGYVLATGQYSWWRYGTSASRKPIDELEGDVVALMVGQQAVPEWEGCVLPISTRIGPIMRVGDLQARQLVERATLNTRLDEMVVRFCRQVGAAHTAYSEAIAEATASLDAGINATEGSAGGAWRTALHAFGRAVSTLPSDNDCLLRTSECSSQLLVAAQQQLTRVMALQSAQQRACAAALETHARAKAAYVEASASANAESMRPLARDPWLGELKLREAAQELHEVRS